VGHTSTENVLKQIGRSYCIDGMQSIYCIFEPSGDIVFKNTSELPFTSIYRDPKNLDLEHINEIEERLIN